MQSLGKLLAGFLIMVMPYSAMATITYEFNFSGLSTGDSLTDGSVVYFDDFGITLNYEDYLTTTGMAKTNEAPQATSLGFDIAFAGANPSSQWGFDDDGAAILDDFGMSFNGTAIWIFWWSPQVLSDFIQTPGTYMGSAHANASFFHNGENISASTNGLATLIVRDSEVSVAEPSSLALLMFGLLGIASMRHTVSKRN